MKARECKFPPASMLSRDLSKFDYWDSFEVSLDRTELSMHEIYLAIFAYPPWWLKSLLVIRTKLVSVVGIGGPTAAQMNSIECKNEYAGGEKIALWTIFMQDENEIITGKNDKHLDFRVSVRKLAEGDANKVVLSTVVKLHNRLGKFYLSFIVPFHKFSVKRIMSNAVT